MDTKDKAAVADPAAADVAQDAAVSLVSGDGLRGVALQVLRQRADFLRAASARRQGMPGFLLQARRRAEDEPVTGIRIGFTCSKKIGNAVIRNRAKRRLRALAREVLPVAAHSGWDYVIVGRPEVTISRDYADLRADLTTALGRVHGAARPKAGA